MQRPRLVAILAIERQITAIWRRLKPFANDHRASASTDDMAEFDRFTAMLGKRRRDLSPGYERLLADLIDGRPGSDPARDRSRAGAAHQ